MSEDNPSGAADDKDFPRRRVAAAEVDMRVVQSVARRLSMGVVRCRCSRVLKLA